MTEPDKFASTDDRRVENNVMRHAYRPLDEDERSAMLAVKDLGKAFYDKLHEIGATSRYEDRFASRELSIAATKIEEAVMWAVKHVTG